MPGPPRTQDFDIKLGNALSLIQLGKWQEASVMLKDLNAFYKEQYTEASKQLANLAGLRATLPAHKAYP